MKTESTWASQRERGNMAWLRVMRWIAMRLGRRVARWILHLIAGYFLLFNRTARQASGVYLSRVFRRPARLGEVYRHFHHFAATVLDRVYFLQDQFQEFDITTTGTAVLHAQIDRGQGVFLIGAHLGSFEALRASAQTRGARAAVVMFEDNARLINAALAAVAPNAALHTIALGQPGSMLNLRRWLDEGGMAGMLADRTLPNQSARSHSIPVTFLGHAAFLSDGPFRLAAMMRRPAVFMAGVYHGGRHYELRFDLLADFSQPLSEGAPDMNARIEAAVRRYAALLEEICLACPYNWFNFFDFWATETHATELTPSQVQS